MTTLIAGSASKCGLAGDSWLLAGRHYDAFSTSAIVALILGEAETHNRRITLGVPVTGVRSNGIW